MTNTWALSALWVVDFWKSLLDRFPQTKSADIPATRIRRSIRLAEIYLHCIRRFPGFHR
jgi:hypothetical protein